MPITRSTGRGKKPVNNADREPQPQASSSEIMPFSDDTGIMESRSTVRMTTSYESTTSGATTLEGILPEFAPEAPAIEETAASASIQMLPRVTSNTADADEYAVPLAPQAIEKKKRTGSTKSTKAMKILKAKEEMARLKLELVAAQLAVLEADSEDDASEYSDETEPDTRVNVWLKNQIDPPMLAINRKFIEERNSGPNIEDASKHGALTQCDEQQGGNNSAQIPRSSVERSGQTISRPAVENTPQRVPTSLVTEQGNPPVTAHEVSGQFQQTPIYKPLSTVPQQPDFAEFTRAITLAVKSSRPRIIDLPFFGGAHQEWLVFKSAYQETESLFSKAENLNRLRKHLLGKAKESVESLLICNSDPIDIMKNLETRFGRPETLARMEMNTLKTLPRVTESPRDICIYHSKIANSVATLKSLNCIYYLYNTEVAQSLVEKMTSALRFRYFDFAATLPEDEPKLLKIEKFFKKEAELCSPYAEPEQSKQETMQYRPRPQRSYIVTENSSTRCLVCDEIGHRIIDCAKFQAADSHERWDIAKNRKLCFRCLHYRNRAHSCKQRACGVEKCKHYHHRMLHFNRNGVKGKDSEDMVHTEITNSTWTVRKQSYLKIIPVTITGPKSVIKTFALLDDGSTVTLIDEKIADDIGITGPIVPLKLQAINQLNTSQRDSRKVDVTLIGNNGRQVNIQARTVKNLKISAQEISKQSLSECSHLKGINKFLTYEHAKPGILIGQDNWSILVTKRMRTGKTNQPVASLTPLGWVLHGGHTKMAPDSVNYISHITEQPDEDLDEHVREYFTMDSLCINPKKPKTDPEEQALRILEKYTVHIDSTRYETALLLKTDTALPNNYENSLERLRNIENKLDKDHRLKQEYSQEIEALVEKGYSELATRHNRNSTDEEKINHIIEIIDIEESKLSEALPDVSRFSNWEKLSYSTARALQLCRYPKRIVNYKRTRVNRIQQESDWNSMVLDGNQPIVKLWIANVHRKLRHAGMEATINKCLRRHWIVRLRHLTRTIVKRHCRMKRVMPLLQHRREPYGRGPGLKIGDLVQVIDSNQPRFTWERGKIIAKFPGSNQIVPAVEIRTQSDILRRPERKLVILPVDSKKAERINDTDSAPK